MPDPHTESHSLGAIPYRLVIDFTEGFTIEGAQPSLETHQLFKQTMPIFISLANHFTVD